MKLSTTLRNLNKMPVKLNLIAACDSKRGIGVNNTLPWRLKNEMAYFNRMTTGGASKDAISTVGDSKRNVVVMGRKTWDSIPPKFQPLKGRINVILSRNKPEKEEIREDVIWTNSWEEVVNTLTELDNKGMVDQVWITGGSYVYKLAIDSPLCHRIYLTRIQNDYECDVFFPEFDLNVFKLIKDPAVPDEEQEESNVKYKFLVYEKINA